MNIGNILYNILPKNEFILIKNMRLTTTRKDVKESIQATWSDIDSNVSNSSTPRDTRYD